MQEKLVRSMIMIIVILLGEYSKENEKKHCYSRGGGVLLSGTAGFVF